MLLSNSKLHSLEETIEIRHQLKLNNKTLVLTNGCFDLLHPGHISYLIEAKKLGDYLMIALNSDESVNKLKGPHRPVQNEIERAYAIAALYFVDGIFIFNSERLTEEIKQIKPDIYTKAGDYTVDSLNSEERQALDDVYAKIKILPFLKGYSTTLLIKKISQAAETF